MTALQIHHLDVRGLAPPEPLEKVLDALDVLGPTDQLRMLIEREPYPLYRILDNNGYLHYTIVLPDFQYEVRIWRGTGE
jgi:hypothetical protein